MPSTTTTTNTGESDGATTTTEEDCVQQQSHPSVILEDMLRVETRVEVSGGHHHDHIALSASLFTKQQLFFAHTLHPSGDLVLVTCSCNSSSSSAVDSDDWTLRTVPWFDDPAKRISAISFDPNAPTLFIGAHDGSVWELNVRRIFSPPPDHHHHHNSDDDPLRDVCHLTGIPVLSLLVYSPNADHTHQHPHQHPQQNGKLVLVTGPGGKCVILADSSPPVVVTFTSSISGWLLFTSPKSGLTSLLVSLESGQNVTTVLDDIDIPTTTTTTESKHHQQQHHPQQKSLFKKAKDNFFSRMSSNSDNSDKTSRKLSSSSNSSSSSSSPSSGVKFTTVDDVSCRGILNKIPHSKHFARHHNNKLDLFDDEFRQTSTVFIPQSVTSIVPLSEKVFAATTHDNSIRIYVSHNGTLKDLAVAHLPVTSTSKILSLTPLSTSGDPTTSFPTLYITTPCGVYELVVSRPALSLCVDLLLSESPSSAQLLDLACTALGVSKPDVCVLAGDTRSIQAKFSKTIIYYKLAGLSYSCITYKFGSRGQIPAMLFFFELVDQERAKIPHAEKLKIAHLALLGRIEQFLRSTAAAAAAAAAANKPQPLTVSSKMLLKKFIKTNAHFSTRTASELLSTSPLLVFALKTLTNTRLSHPNTIDAILLHKNNLAPIQHTRLWWTLLIGDWLSVWSSPPDWLAFFTATVSRALPHLHPSILTRIQTVLTPWRPELSHLIHTHIGPTTTSSDVIIDFASDDTTTVPVTDILTLFIHTLIEAAKRNNKRIHASASLHHKTPPPFVAPPPTTTTSSKDVTTVTSLLLSYSRAFTRSLSASATHVLVSRNSRLLAWGENKLGTLGIPESTTRRPSSSTNNNYTRPIIDTPTLVDLPPQLKISVHSVAAGQHHNIALTSSGTLLVWGSNKYGQLGLPKSTVFVSRPVPLDNSSSSSRRFFTCISAGSYHSAAIDSNHVLWMWGWGAHGQLGNNHIENKHSPQPVTLLKEKAVYVSCGHSHTAVLSSSGKVYTFGCNHFGQLGINSKSLHKVKTPTLVNNNNAVIRLVEAGTTSTVMVTTKNRLYYAGLNPASLKSIINSNRSKKHAAVTPTQNVTPTQQHEEEDEDDPSTASRDFIQPTHIDTSHMAGDISKASLGSTHFVLLTSLGYVYTWGLGKSGQLVRPDDDTKTLELIDPTTEMTPTTTDQQQQQHSQQRMIIASDVAAAADCTFIVEKDSGNLFACGFNSNGQLGKLESEDDVSVMTVKTKKRVVRIRQPSNIHFKLRHIPGIPKQTKWNHTNNDLVNNDGDNKQECPAEHTIKSPQDTLLWTLKHYHGLYNHNYTLKKCVEVGNSGAASVLETLAENHEEALKHQLAHTNTNNDDDYLKHIDNYVNNNSPNYNKALRLLTLLVTFWSRRGLPASSLEDILTTHRQTNPNWATHINSAVRTAIDSDSPTAQWISTNLTPIFILSTIHHTTEPHPPLLSSSSSSPDSSKSSSSDLLPPLLSSPTGRK